MLNQKHHSALSSLVVDEFASSQQMLHDRRYSHTLESLKFVQSFQVVMPRISDKLFESTKSSATQLLHRIFNSVQDTCNQPELDECFQYLLVQNCPLHILLHPAFVEYYVRRGRVYVQTVNSHIETDVTATLGPDGVLHLSSDEITYKRIGLIGQQSKQYAKKNYFPKHLIQLPINDDQYRSTNSRNYQRAFTSLRNAHIKLDLLIKWIPPTESELSSLSIRKFFELIKYDQSGEENFGKFLNFPQDRELLSFSTCIPQVRKFIAYDVALPPFPDWNQVHNRPESNEINFKDTDIANLIETFGGALAGINFDADEEVSQWAYDPEQDQTTNLLCWEIQGFFNEIDVQMIIDQLQVLLDSCPECRFFVLVVNGFEDSVIAWYEEKNCEHGKNVSGENLYGILVGKDSYSFIWRTADEFSYGIERL